MKILYLFTRDQDATVAALAAGQGKEHTVSQTDLRTEQDYEAIVKQLEEVDQVICW